MKIGVLEGLLFVTGDDGLSLEDVVKLLEVSKDEALKLLEQYKKSLEFENRGLKLVYLGNKYKLTTKEEHKKYYELPNYTNVVNATTSLLNIFKPILLVSI